MAAVNERASVLEGKRSIGGIKQPCVDCMRMRGRLAPWYYAAREGQTASGLRRGRLPPLPSGKPAAGRGCLPRSGGNLTGAHHLDVPLTVRRACKNRRAVLLALGILSRHQDHSQDRSLTRPYVIFY